ncbi:19639_t:CDS:2, partial [Racocetra persica]
IIKPPTTSNIKGDSTSNNDKIVFAKEKAPKKKHAQIEQQKPFKNNTNNATPTSNGSTKTIAVERKVG